MRHLGRGILLFGLGLALLAYGRDTFDRWVDQTELPVVLSETSVEILDRSGRLLRVFPVENGRWRLAVDQEAVEPAYLDMLIAYEDSRFYEHRGVDPLAIGRALLQAGRNGRIVSGASTLTMQLARLLEHSGTGHWSGKVRQARVALALERKLTKDQILDLYLLHAPFGGALEGMRAASLAWFGKEPRRLSVAEAALLVALPQAPEARRPDRFPSAAREARNRVISLMLERAQLSEDEAELGLKEPLPLKMRPFPMLAMHTADALRAGALGEGRIETTIDGDLQGALETLLRDRVKALGAGVSMAAMVVAPSTGEILASLGAAEYSSADGRRGFIDMTRAPRSPGSTLKPLVYAMAFDQGLVHPETMIHDGPVRFGTYAPQNFDGVFRGDLTVRRALQLSLNTPVVQLADALGPARIMAALRSVGADPSLPGSSAGLAVSLGGVGVSLRDLTQLYAALANGGSAPILHERLGASQPVGRVVNRAAAWHVGDILRETPAPFGLPSGKVAFKTGTSYGHRDVWAIGWDGARVVAVWVGRPDGTPMPGAFGAEIAAPLLFEIFARVPEGISQLSPPPPETLIVDTMALPLPLRRFGSAQVAQNQKSGPRVLFPPDNARLSLNSEELTVKIGGGSPPFSLFLNGAPILTRTYHREISLTSPGPGFSSVVFVDANGQSARVKIRVD